MAHFRTFYNTKHNSTMYTLTHRFAVIVACELVMVCRTYGKVVQSQMWINFMYMMYCQYIVIHSKLFAIWTASFNACIVLHN